MAPCLILRSVRFLCVRNSIYRKICCYAVCVVKINYSVTKVEDCSIVSGL